MFNFNQKNENIRKQKDWREEHIKKYYENLKEEQKKENKSDFDLFKEKEKQTKESSTTEQTPKLKGYVSKTEYIDEDKEDKNDNKDNQGWIMPCEGEIRGTYGEKRTDHIHNGIDIAVPVGTPVKTIADGKIIAVGPAKGYGKWVVVDHGIINGERVISEYGHISSSDMKIGQAVKKGDIIAKSGNEGRSDGPHVHITIREGQFSKGKAVDPYKYIDKNYFKSR